MYNFAHTMATPIFIPESSLISGRLPCTLIYAYIGFAEPRAYQASAPQLHTLIFLTAMVLGSLPAENRAVCDSSTLLVRNVRLSDIRDNASAISKLYNVTCVDGTVVSIVESHNNTSEDSHLISAEAGQGEGIDEVLDAKGLGVLLPGCVLCTHHFSEAESSHSTIQTMSCAHPPRQVLSPVAL